MFSFLFNIIIDWTIGGTPPMQVLRWKFTTVLEDIDYVDDPSRHKGLHEKCSRLHRLSRYSTKVAEAIFIDELEIKDLNSFICLAATVYEAGGSHEVIRCRLSIARRAYSTLNSIWRTKMHSKHTKLIIPVRR